MKTDFFSWVEQNEELFHELFHHDSMIFDQWSMVLKVTTHIDQLPKKDRNADLDIIFDVGYAYLFQKVNDFKNYLNQYFHADIHHFLPYDRTLYYLFYCEDLKDSLLEQERYTTIIADVLERIMEKLETALTKHKKPTDDDFDGWDQEMMMVIPANQTILTTPEIFAQAAEELDI